MTLLDVSVTHLMMIIRSGFCACLLSISAGQLTAHAEQSRRPLSMDLESFQSGPDNRWAFSHLREVLPTVNIPRDQSGFKELQISPNVVSDFSVDFQGGTQSIHDIAASQYLDGLLIIKNDEIIVENYYGHLSEGRPHLINSMSKSIVGLLARKLAFDGLIDLDRPVSHYLPALSESGYGPDSLESLLDMRDGSKWSEDYEDLTSTFRIQDCATGWTDADYCPEIGPSSLYTFLPRVGRDPSKLGAFEYRSGSVNVIGWVLESVTKQPLADLISTYIWKPMGAEFDANITVDKGGFALADHGVSASLRDFGRFGLLMLNDGKSFGNQVIPSAVVNDIINQKGDPTWSLPSRPGYKPFYRSFWWGEGNPRGDIGGKGIHGQTLRVVPKADMVIVMYSSWPRAEVNGDRVGWLQADELVDSLVAKFR